jgi:hypothetical protein
MLSSLPETRIRYPRQSSRATIDEAYRAQDPARLEAGADLQKRNQSCARDVQLRRYTGLQR